MSDEKAGTTPQDGGDDAAKAALAGTPEAADRDASQDEEQKRTDWKALYLSSKDKIEEANRLQERIDALEAERAARPQSPTTPTSSPEDEEMRQLVQEVAEAEQLVRNNNDPAAKLSLRLLKMQLADSRQRTEERRVEQTERADHDYLMTATVVGDDGEERPLTSKEREELKQFRKRNAEHFTSMAAAHDAQLGRELKKVRKELALQKARLTRDVQARDEGVVKTHEVEVPASEAKARRMKESEFNTKIAQLEADGRHAEAFKLRQDAFHGRLDLTR